MTVINDYHQRVNQEKLKSVAYWKKHPLSHEECLNQFRHLGTEACKGVQIARLKDWSINHECW